MLFHSINIVLPTKKQVKYVLKLIETKDCDDNGRYLDLTIENWTLTQNSILDKATYFSLLRTEPFLSLRMNVSIFNFIEYNASIEGTGLIEMNYQPDVFTWDNHLNLVNYSFTNISNEGLLTTYKNSLTILAERNKNRISGFLQVGLINRAAEALNDNSSSQQQPSQVISMNILAVLDQVLTAAEKISNSSKLNDRLEMLKNETKSKEIIWKSKSVLSKLEKQEEEEDNDENQQKYAIEAGTVDSLLRLLSTQPLERISMSHIYAFFIFINSSSDEIGEILYNRNPYISLIHLFDHQDFFIINRAAISLFNLLNNGARTRPSIAPHPHYQNMIAFGGIQKLFTLFKKYANKDIKISTSLCFGHLLRAKLIHD
ncbi:MAG: hypothetical protein EZS28_036703, partial [Streblomastix strix]